MVGADNSEGSPIGQNDDSPAFCEQLPQESFWERRDRYAAERMKVDYEPLDKWPSFAVATSRIISNLDNLLIHQGQEPIDWDLSSVRFVDTIDFPKVTATVNVPVENVGGFFDSDNNTIFLVCDRKDFGKNPEDNIWNIYGEAHELGHRVTPELEKLSFHLSEGFADFIAREILDRETLQLVAPVHAIDIPFCRIEQLAMVDQIREHLGEVVFNELLTNALKGAGYVQWMLDKMYGSELVALLGKSDNESIEKIATYFKNKKAHK